MTMPSLFQIAAYFEDFFPDGGLQRSVSALWPSPLADFLLHPERLNAWLASAVKGYAPAIAPLRNGQRSPKRAPQNGTPKESAGSRTGWPSDQPRDPQTVEFVLNAPAARSVKLAADFTDWDQNPVDLMNVRGQWRATIPLAPGLYSYRFIVDGRWCDDPRSTQRVPNPFGTENSVILVP